MTGQSAFNDVEQDLLSLPSRFGGLGVINYASSQFSSSFSITAPLVDLILNQSSLYSMKVVELQLSVKQQAIASHHQFLSNYNHILPILSPKLQRSVLLSSEKGSSSWLTTIPLSDHGYALHS